VRTHQTNQEPRIGSAFGTLPPVLRNATFNAVAIDSRDVKSGDLFVALPGEHTDGHHFVATAFRQGACAAIVREDWVKEAAHDLPTQITVVDAASTELHAPTLVPVADPLQTLQALAAHHRTMVDVPVIGITGSVGKTSTKQLVAAVLSQHLATLSNVRSFNNEIGVPLTLLRLRATHQAAVIEMGTYGPGEIAFLCRMALPQYAVVTNVGVSHLERMGSRDVVARAKAELVESLPEDGLAILNGDDPRVRAMRDRTAARVLMYGLGIDNDVYASEIGGGGLAPITFTVHIDGKRRRIQTGLLGEHNVYTALAAIAIARELDVPWAAIETGLNTPEAQARLRPLRGINGATLLDDTYNASPASCVAALHVLAQTPGRHIAVFGEMAELGPEEEAGHREVGTYAAPIVDLLVVVGTKARLIGEAATASDPRLDVVYTANNAEAVTVLRERIGADDYVLVKGARVAATEQIVAALAKEGSS
jgi:UDP-N-acetylmuramoyl-tripeptide--D-alanyl-D-alanine ligase